MATPPFVINEALPGDTDVVAQHPANARAFRDIVEDYLNTDHDFNTGHHAAVGLVEVAAPSGVANTGWIYCKDVAGATELFWKDDDGTEKQLTAAGFLNVTAADIPAGAVGTSEIADNSVTGAKIAMGGDVKGDLLAYNGTDYVRRPVGTNGQVLMADSAEADGVKWATPGLTRGTAQNLAGAGVTFNTGIPATASRITIMFTAMSLNGTEDVLVRIGPSGGVVSAGYEALASNYTSGAGNDNPVTVTNGFVMQLVAAADSYHGTMVLTRINGNTWLATHSIASSINSVSRSVGAGAVTLADVLTQFSVVPTGSDNFDAGSVNFIVE